MFKLTLFWKLTALTALTLLMLIPIMMVRGVIDERFSYQRDVISNISDSVGGSQEIIGPILVMPYSQKEVVKTENGNVTRMVRYERYALPEILDIQGKANIEARKLGIYKAQIYQTDMAFLGKFTAPDLTFLQREGVIAEEPYLVLLVSDSKGITRAPQIKINQAAIEFQPGTKNSFKSNGIHAALTYQQLNSGGFDFDFSLALQGSSELSVVPIGRSTQYQLSGNWPHPSFLGSYLPVKREVSEQGFSATWQSSWLANNISDKFASAMEDKSDLRLSGLPSFYTSLLEPVDQYQLNDRAVKYAILFISLTFLGFFLFEMIKGLQLHSIQYLLVGLALVTFYLLLLALSERIGFNSAYAVGSLACSGLISFYLCAVLGGLARGISFGGGLLTLYAVLFGLLQSEGNALLLGSLLLFAILAVVMVITRRLDWYQISQRTQKRTSLPASCIESKTKAVTGGPAEETSDHNKEAEGLRIWK